MSCPVCGKSPQDQFAPFCSEHCKNVDLLKWISGDYRIPVRETPMPTSDDIEKSDE